MKIALCISGYFTNINNDNLLNSNYIYDNIINKINYNENSLDIFIHSFDINSKKNILNKYPNTKDFIIEEQINFINKLTNLNHEYYNKLIKINYKHNTSYDLQNTLSMLYSRCKVIKMAIKYSSNNNFKYDAIIRVRFDIGIRMKHSHNGFKPDNFIFNCNSYDYNYIYSSYWNQLNAGYVDHWEFSNSDNMNRFSNIYNYVINKMFILNSDYLYSLENNWIDSNENNYMSNEILNNDISNEIFNNIKKYKYKLLDSINNRVIQKYFMLKNGLYQKSRFIDFTNDNNGKLYTINKYCISKYCIFLYSHSDYSDIWNLTFGQIYKHIDLDEVSIIFCVNKLNNYNIDNRIKVVYYDDSQIYSDRILNNIMNLNYEYILFLHEDWVIINDFSNMYILDIMNFMKKNNILHIRSYKNYGKSNINPDIFNIKLNISNIPVPTTHFISIQPGLWEKKMLIELYSNKSDKPNILEEKTNNNIFINKYKNCFYFETINIAENSKMFPHIHTIAYGRWALCNDYYNKLETLLLYYNINIKIRGYFNRKKGIDVYGI